MLEKTIWNVFVWHDVTEAERQFSPYTEARIQKNEGSVLAAGLQEAALEADAKVSGLHDTGRPLR